MNYSYEMSSIKPLLINAFAEKEGSYIVHEIITRFPTIRELMNVSEQELLSIKGVGKVKARQIVAALQLAQRLSRPACSQPRIIRKPQDAADLLMQEMRYLQQEHFVTLFLNTKNHVIGQPETLSIGSLNTAIVHPAIVFRAAVKRSSASIVVCHNHPSGDPTPSAEDIQLTKRLSEAGDVIGVDLLDHIIIGDGIFVSLKERGLM
ncbi:DNA repair protein RadC [Paenibacillus sp. M1]|uniref:DNA repair protein RadC n=1 Tax=Paenibacillus haidiansis TaxID=1574488 RepID=A0ABU7VS15_9BACL